MKKNYSSIIWGFCLLVLGLIFLGNSIGFINFTLFFNGWWTLFIIVPSLCGLFSSDGKILNMVLLILGVTLLLAQQGIIEFKLVWGITLSSFIILEGINLIYIGIKRKKDFSKDFNHNYCSNEKQEMKKYIAVFGGSKDRYFNRNFYGANILAVFGGVDLDLREAIICRDVYIDAVSIFGGCDIKVPNNVNVKINGTNIFGGTSNKTANESINAPTLYINAITLFGGVDVK